MSYKRFIYTQYPAMLHNAVSDLFPKPISLRPSRRPQDVNVWVVEGPDCYKRQMDALVERFDES